MRISTYSWTLCIGNTPWTFIDKIFDAFYTTKDRGIGLGLSIVHKIIDEHDGTIEVKSTPGEGTAFHIFLPIFV